MAQRNPITPAGLHLLRSRFQKQFLAEQCRELTTCLSDAIAATMAAAPIRVGKRYVHDRSEPRQTRADEANWEEALFRSHWAEPQVGSGAPWKRLLTYQVLLQNARSDQNWGEIDLLGVSTRDLPVVIELKASTSQESPVEMLVQATAYAVAVKRAWPSCLRAEWAGVLGISADALPAQLEQCELVCAAPSEYWVNWVGGTSGERYLSSEAWAAIAELRKSITKSGFPSTFVRLEHEGASATNISVTEQQLPEA